MSSPDQLSDNLVTAQTIDANSSKPVTASEAQRTENTTVHVRDKGALEYAPAGKRTSQVIMVTAPID